MTNMVVINKDSEYYGQTGDFVEWCETDDYGTVCTVQLPGKRVMFRKSHIAIVQNRQFAYVDEEGEQVAHLPVRSGHDFIEIAESDAIDSIRDGFIGQGQFNHFLKQINTATVGDIIYLPNGDPYLKRIQ